MQRVSQKGAAFIAMEEGVVPAPYYDKVKRLTWGIGHTAAAGDPNPAHFPMNMPSNVDGVVKEAVKVFDRELDEYAAVVLEKFKGPLAQHELDGLASWHYNTGGAYKSSAIKHWNRGDKERAVQIIGSWNKVTINGKKKVSKVLDKRRDSEMAMILHGEYPTDEELAIPIWGTNGRGKVVWEPLDYIEWRDLEAGARPSQGLGAGGVAAGIGGAIAALTAALAAFWDKIGGALPW